MRKTLPTKKAIHLVSVKSGTAPGPKGWPRNTYRIDRRDVTLLTVSGIWAMVSRDGCEPYVCRRKELEIL
jgi:hypothetical protein